MNATVALHRRSATTVAPVRPVDPVQGLIDRARAERATKLRLSPEHAYYVGVEAAAEQVRHPDLDWTKTVSWLDRHHPAFVAGYVETSSRLAPMWSWPATPRSQCRDY